MENKKLANSIKLLAALMFGFSVVSLYQWWMLMPSFFSPFIAILVLVASPYFYLMSKTIKID